MNVFDFRALICFGILIAQLMFLPAVKAEESKPIAGTSKEDSISWYRPEKWQSLGSLGFRLAAFPDDSFVMIFPEWITAQEQSWHVPLKWELHGRTAKGTWQEDDCRLDLTLAYTDGESPSLAWEYVFQNNSKTTLTDVAAFNCFNLVDAPTFKDLKMERTWVGKAKKSAKRLANVKKTQGPRTLQFYPAKDGLNLTEFERFGRYGATSTQELSGDRMGVESTDKAWSLQCIVEGPVAYFFNNWEADHGCVHAAPLLGDIAPGKTTSAKGKIVFIREMSVK